METYANLVEAINGLRSQGYTEDFNLHANCLKCEVIDYDIMHDEFEIDKEFRFDADTNPSDESIIYAVHSEKYGIKGILINSYGVYSDEIAEEMLVKLVKGVD